MLPSTYQVFAEKNWRTLFVSQSSRCQKFYQIGPGQSHKSYWMPLFMIVQLKKPVSILLFIYFYSVSFFIWYNYVFLQFFFIHSILNQVTDTSSVGLPRFLMFKAVIECISSMHKFFNIALFVHWEVHFMAVININWGFMFKKLHASLEMEHLTRKFHYYTKLMGEYECHYWERILLFLFLKSTFES